MPSVHKKRAQNSITFETKKIEEKRPVLTIGKTRRSKEHVAGLVIGRTLIRKGHYLECPPMPVIGRTASPKARLPGRPPIPVIGKMAATLKVHK